ncbi:MAG TPA: hypothetical protein VGE59_03955, partial [Patescibacteria group bacterium]
QAILSSGHQCVGGQCNLCRVVPAHIPSSRGRWVIDVDEETAQLTEVGATRHEASPARPAAIAPPVAQTPRPVPTPPVRVVTEEEPGSHWTDRI